MSSEEINDALSMVYAERGYLVLAFDGPRAVGYVTKTAEHGDGTPLGQPFRVVKQTDYADLLTQLRMIGLSGDPYLTFEDHFYRVESD